MGGAFQGFATYHLGEWGYYKMGLNRGNAALEIVTHCKTNNELPGVRKSCKILTCFFSGHFLLFTVYHIALVSQIVPQVFSEFSFS